MDILPTLRSALSRKDFDKKFQPAFRELEYLRLMAFQKKGFWIFQAHAFSMDELLESPQFTKIEAVIGKIGDDVENWLQNGQLSFFDKQFYWENKIILEDQVHQLRTEIIKRQPTWWEGFCNAFDHWLNLFMAKLPELATSFLPIQVAHLALKTASGQKMVKRLLPSLNQ